MTKLSVLISVYHKERPEHLRQSLESIFQQETPADEVVLVEDGPLTDSLRQVIRQMQEHYPQLNFSIMLGTEKQLQKLLEKI